MWKHHNKTLTHLGFYKQKEPWHSVACLVGQPGPQVP